jgi:multidrug efflux system membrane fusion protein
VELLSHSPTLKWLGRSIGIATVFAAVVLAVLVIQETGQHPSTDDANVRANFIEIVAEVSGRLVELPVKDNALVKKGDLLFAIDSRPYEYALHQALSDQANLEQQIIDEGRKIAAQNSAVEAASASLTQSTTGIKTATSSVEVTKATVSRAQATATAAEAQLRLATNNLNRIEPLLEKQYVTVEQVDTERTALRVAQGNYDESQAALAQAQAQQRRPSSPSRFMQSTV